MVKATISGLIITVILLAGCATMHSYTPTSSYYEKDSRSINDEDILKAFEANPQLVTPVKVAWYSMSRDSLAEKCTISDSSLVSINYPIPRSLIEGFDPLFEQPEYMYYRDPKPLDFRALRLLAARAKCDLVVLVSSRFAQQGTLNGWAWFNVLLFPVFFTPYLDIEYRYAAEAFVFDVRNGYMYRHLTYNDAAIVKTVGIIRADAVTDSVNTAMLDSASISLKRELMELFRQTMQDAPAPSAD